MKKDPDSELNQMVYKRMAKKKVKKERNTIKEENKNEL